MSSIKPFSFDTIEDFDDHISKSIPNYHLLSSAICDLSTFFVQDKTSVIDLGCSTGKLLEQIPFQGQKIGLDIATNLLPKSHDNVQYHQSDLMELEELPPASLILSIFTLQFIPIEHRINIMKRVHEALVPNGAFIWAEKVYEFDGLYERIFSNAYYDFKRQSFTTQEIMDKERDLRKLMKPQSTFDNQKMAVQAGFLDGAMFWKFYDFEAWVYIKK